MAITIPNKAAPPSRRISFRLKVLPGMKICQHSFEMEIIIVMKNDRRRRFLICLKPNSL
ncbi:MAG: hypothetical protein AABY78_09875 [Nitrospirota bacterium]